MCYHYVKIILVISAVEISKIFIYEINFIV